MSSSLLYKPSYPSFINDLDSFILNHQGLWKSSFGETAHPYEMPTEKHVIQITLPVRHTTQFNQSGIQKTSSQLPTNLFNKVLWNNAIQASALVWFGNLTVETLIYIPNSFILNNYYIIWFVCNTKTLF